MLRVSADLRLTPCARPSFSLPHKAAMYVLFVSHGHHIQFYTEIYCSRCTKMYTTHHIRCSTARRRKRKPQKVLLMENCAGIPM